MVRNMMWRGVVASSDGAATSGLPLSWGERTVLTVHLMQLPAKTKGFMCAAFAFRGLISAAL